ncbi:asparaginase [Antarcticirhabdus aurantiaca]|uniref:Asparaginase n=1 Tax=Antarcticirhabdus aurantiaca TaxID=2606717 RepID=A0ACD4NI52_9HYPH|nr:asparaginase [Jeongeuplla avenae]
MAKSRVRIIVLGGTITMAPSAPGAGITPNLTGEDLVAAVPELAEIAEIEVETPFLKPGSTLSYADLARVSGMANAALKEGAAGVVVVQGTDTIDETSFLFDLAGDHPRPIVVTGAMRGAKAPGADGNASLLAAVTAAASPRTEGLGALVVLNDEIHAARLVEKGHTALASAFVSPGFGPLGHVVEGEARIVLRPAAPGWRAGPLPAEMPRVPILKPGIGEDGAAVEALVALGAGGLVVEGMGAGHVPAAFAEALGEAAKRIPVVLATRVAAGRVFRRTYGAPGSEIDLLGRGLVPAGLLSPHKARLLLSVLVAQGANGATIRAAFDAYD